MNSSPKLDMKLHGLDSSAMAAEMRGVCIRARGKVGWQNKVVTQEA